MILDTSALAAIFFDEPEAAATHCAMSAATFVELSMVLESQIGPGAVQQWDELLERTGIVVEPVTVEQAYIARQSFTRFGKGRHPAALNFGDCFSYGLAKVKNEPLLFKGNDFTRTDILSARVV